MFVLDFLCIHPSFYDGTLIATLQLVNETCNVAFLCPNDELAVLSWREFMEYLNKKISGTEHLSEITPSVCQQDGAV
jgi:hypothetical protein